MIAFNEALNDFQTFLEDIKQLRPYLKIYTREMTSLFNILRDSKKAFIKYMQRPTKSFSNFMAYI